jgi:hypothetical protein
MNGMHNAPTPSLCTYIYVLLSLSGNIPFVLQKIEDLDIRFIMLAISNAGGTIAMDVCSQENISYVLFVISVF